MERSSQKVREKEPLSDATQTAGIERSRATQVWRTRRLRLSSSRCSLLRRRLVRHRIRVGRTAGCREQQHQKVCHSGNSAKGREDEGKRERPRGSPLRGRLPTRVKKRSGGKRLYVDDRVGLSDKVGRLRDEELPLILTLAQHLTLHAHELHFAFGIERTV